jgi:thioredoxin-related protein
MSYLFIKKNTAIILLFISLFISSCNEKEKIPVRYTPVTEFDAARNPFADLRDAVKEARKSNKRIILDVGGVWCSWCYKLDHLYEQNPDLNEYLQAHFIVIKINYSKENKNEKFLSQFPAIPGYPHLFVLEDNGTFLYSQDTEKLEKGKSHDKDKVFAFLKKWAKK